eukprot:m51a1_g8556 hypothetical protein (252) ;mRNA; r:156254-157219
MICDVVVLALAVLVLVAVLLQSCTSGLHTASCPASPQPSHAGSSANRPSLDALVPVAQAPQGLPLVGIEPLEHSAHGEDLEHAPQIVGVPGAAEPAAPEGHGTPRAHSKQQNAVHCPEHHKDVDSGPKQPIVQEHRSPRSRAPPVVALPLLPKHATPAGTRRPREVVLRIPNGAAAVPARVPSSAVQGLLPLPQRMPLLPVSAAGRPARASIRNGGQQPVMGAFLLDDYDLENLHVNACRRWHRRNNLGSK